ncbi:MAG: hypothetical protein RLZZ15_115 [Verrucomicrobiota bacterium]|jgi:hypothetical protein
MNPTRPTPEPVFPLAGIPADRTALRAPRLACGVRAELSPLALHSHAYLRTWTARRPTACGNAIRAVAGASLR